MDAAYSSSCTKPISHLRPQTGLTGPAQVTPECLEPQTASNAMALDAKSKPDSRVTNVRGCIEKIRASGSPEGLRMIELNTIATAILI